MGQISAGHFATAEKQLPSLHSILNELEKIMRRLRLNLAYEPILEATNAFGDEIGHQKAPSPAPRGK